MSEPTSSNVSASSIENPLADIVDALELAHARLAIVSDAGTLSAAPQVEMADRRWRKALPGDGAAEALLDLVAGVSVTRQLGRFTVRSWTEITATGEQPVGVDQTNESVIVGDSAVVKWATHLQQGPHPAPQRISALRDAGFTGMPVPWGLVTWQPPEGAETLVAYADEYLPGAVDGWTWAVDMVTSAALGHDTAALSNAASEVGALVADMHAALSPTASIASENDAARWRDDALEVLDIACALGDFPSSTILRDRREQVSSELEILGTLAGTVVIDGHGDLHVGQVLHSAGRFVVTDFDGNPVLPASERILPITAAVDVAGMAQSLAHVAVVARRHTPLDARALADADESARGNFLDAYARRLADLGHTDLYDARALRALRIQQAMREMIYAARHLPRWMYVPDAALPALVDADTDS